MADIAMKLRAWCTDWNGAAMVRGEPPRDGLHCEDLLDAAAEIERLRAALENARRDFCGIAPQRGSKSRNGPIIDAAIRRIEDALALEQSPTKES